MGAEKGFLFRLDDWRGRKDRQAQAVLWPALLLIKDLMKHITILTVGEGDG